MIGGSAQERLFVRLAASQGVEADVLSSEVSLATNEAMQPAVGYRQAFAEQMDSTCLVGAALAVRIEQLTAEGLSSSKTRGSADRS